MGGRVERFRRTWRMKAPLEMFLSALGLGAYVAGVLCVAIAVFLFTSIDEKDPGFPAGEGFLKAIKGYGVGFFAASAAVCYFLGKWLFESRVPGARRSVAARYEASRIATELAADPDFQNAGSWEWRVRVAHSLLPELREYAESDDWADRRFAHQAVKEAWELHLKRARDL